MSTEKAVVLFAAIIAAAITFSVLVDRDGKITSAYISQGYSRVNTPVGQQWIKVTPEMMTVHQTGTEAPATVAPATKPALPAPTGGK